MLGNPVNIGRERPNVRVIVQFLIAGLEHGALAVDDKCVDPVLVH